METELWPAFLWEAHNRGIPALLVNARISSRAFPRYNRIRRWVGPLLRTLAAIQAQSEMDAERFLTLGANRDRVSVIGNLKFDLPPPNPSDAQVRALRRARAGGWRVVVGGSTHFGEEAALLDAVEQVNVQGARVGLVLAPRHLERLAEVEDLIRTRGGSAIRWSSLRQPLEAGILEAFASGRVVMVDEYGLLGRLYGGSECAFVGGTLVPVGGHNLLEPLNWGVPVVFGPHTDNAPEIRDQVLSRSLGIEVNRSEDLPEALSRYLRVPSMSENVRKGAGALFETHRGAVDQALAALERVGAFGGGG